MGVDAATLSHRLHIHTHIRNRTHIRTHIHIHNHAHTHIHIHLHTTFYTTRPPLTRHEYHTTYGHTHIYPENHRTHLSTPLSHPFPRRGRASLDNATVSDTIAPISSVLLHMRGFYHLLYPFCDFEFFWFGSGAAYHHFERRYLGWRGGAWIWGHGYGVCGHRVSSGAELGWGFPGLDYGVGLFFIFMACWRFFLVELNAA